MVKAKHKKKQIHNVAAENNNDKNEKNEGFQKVRND